MKASELIIALKNAIESFGDLEVRKLVLDEEYGNFYDVEIERVAIEIDDDRPFLYIK